METLCVSITSDPIFICVQDDFLASSVSSQYLGANPSGKVCSAVKHSYEKLPGRSGPVIY